MLRDKAVALLNIRPDEIRMVGLMAVLFLLVQAAQGFGDTAAFALFVSRNVDRLPYMYAPLGIIVFVVSLGYTASLGRYQNSSVVQWFLAGFVVLLLAEWAAIALLGISITQIFWLTVNGMGIVLGTLLWTAAGEVCDARQAKRLFPFFTSIGILGSVLGNSLTGLAAKVVGTNNLIVVYAAVLGGSWFLLREVARGYFKPEPPSLIAYNLWNDLRSGFDFVRGSGLFRLVAFSSILYSILFFTVDFPFSQFVSQNFLEDEVRLANFKGLFNSASTLVTFFVSLIVANRLYARLGIVNSILIMPVTYLAGFALFFIFFRFETAVSFRFAQQIILGGVMGAAWNALFNVVPLERRAQTLAFMTGVPAQVGVALSGVLLILGARVFSSTQQILIMGALVALICVYVTWRMRAEYGNALVSALQAGRVEVFSDQEEAFAGYANDPAAMQAAFKALHDIKPFTRRLAAEMLAKMGSPFAIPDLIERLADEDAGVRVAAAKALADLNAKPAIVNLMRGLDDADDSVREQTLASLTKLEVASSPALILALERLLKDRHIRVGARAAVVLAYLGEARQANSHLARLLRDEDPHTRGVALEAYRAIAANAHDTISCNLDLILNALNDPVPEVRREAARAASFFKDAAAIESIARHLADGDPGVRRAASESLKRVWPESRSVLLKILNESDGVAASSVLDSIPAGDAQVLHPLRAYIQREAANIHYLRGLIDSIPPRGRMIKLLADTLKHRISLHEEQLVKSVGLFGNARAMELVRKGLMAGDAGARASALEALETLGDKRIASEVLPILDRGGVFQSDEAKRDVAEVVEIFITSEDRWLRAMGAYAAIELEVEKFYPEVRKLSTLDPEDLVRDAAKSAWSFLGGSINMKTLKTLSTLDRVLLLREVPMFTGLSPEDLEKIAEIAEEQLFLDQALLCREGEPGSALFIIASGRVDVIKKAGSSEKIIATRETGEFVGEMAVLESAPRSATLKAHGGVRTLVISGDTFHTILLDRPQVAVSVLKRMSTRVRELNEKFGAA